MRLVKQILGGLFLSITVLGAATRPAGAQAPANVLVVVNDTSEASRRVGDYYTQKRAIPPANVVHLKAPITETISRAEFAAALEAPIVNALSKRSLQDRIFYIVLTKGVPLRIAGTPGRSGTRASVDSELTLLYRKMAGTFVPLDGAVANPYYGGGRPDVHTQFSHAAQDIYLVTRLDGFTVEDAMALVDRSLAATATSGAIVLDQRGGSAKQGDEWLASAAVRLRGMNWGERVFLETSDARATADVPRLGYFSWGSNDSALTTRVLPGKFAPGALAAMFLSSDARTMVEPPATWRPGAAESNYAGSAQSLTGDLLRAGVTGAAGQVAEPYLDSAVRPDILFPDYVSGLNLAEAFYRAIPSLSWQTVVFGDPLCAPFRTSGVPAGELDAPLDPETDLPAQFSERRLQTTEPGSTPAVRKLLLRADARRVKGDIEGAVTALESATAMDGKLTNAFKALSLLYEQTGQTDKARIAYQRTLANNPDDVVALNNLAYAMAVRDHKPADALPLAERAFTLANGAGLVADTLGWIKHLLGDEAAALPLLERAAKENPATLDVQLHVAAAYAAAGRLQEAAKALRAARALDPAVEKREDYQAVQKRIGGLSPGDGR
jgi:uncharacterized protein (TIGR03790 family)